MTYTEDQDNSYQDVIEATAPYLPAYLYGRRPVGLKLRDPQFQATLAVFKRYEEGVRRPLVVLPTGVGKTKFAGGVSGRVRRTIFAVPREELLTQTVDMYRAMYPHDKVGVVAGPLSQAGNEYRIVVAMLPTLYERLAKRNANRLDIGDVDLFVIDEAHHATARTWRATAEAVPSRIRLGMSATPERTDGAPLTHLFDEIVFQMSLRDAIAQRYLVPPRVTRVKTNIRLDRVRATAGDFVAKQLAGAVNIPSRNELVVKTYVEHGRDLKTNRFRKAVTFCVDIAHAQNLAEVFSAHGIPTQAVWGDDKDRKRKLAAHAAGDLLNITNAAVLCLDDQTELLTARGWVGMNDMQSGDLVANWDDGAVTFEPPLEIVRRPRQDWERMVMLNAADRSVRVTEGHRMLHLNEDGQWTKSAARDLTACDAPVIMPVSGLHHPPGAALFSEADISALTGLLRAGHPDARDVLAAVTAPQFAALIERIGTPEHQGWRVSGYPAASADLLQAVAVTRQHTAVIVGGGRHPDVLIAWGDTAEYGPHVRGPRFGFFIDPSPWKPETVWCVKTRTRNLITRRLGTVTVMGNTEGYDDPTISANILARPTASRSLYVQMLGRSLRLHPGKMDSAVFDFVDNTGKHDLMTAWKFLGDLERVNPKTGKKRAASERDIDPDMIFENYAEMGGNLPLFSFMEQVDLLRLPPEVIPRTVGTTGWHVEPPTEAQLKTLQENGHDVTKTDWTRGMAQAVIESLPPSTKQVILLLAHEYDIFTRRWTRGEVDRALADAREQGVKANWDRVKTLIPNYRAAFK